MSTHYDVLGMTPDAAPEALARSHAARVAFQEERRATASFEQERAEADAALAQLVVAWEVLGDPQRRAEYDRSLGRPGPGPTPGGDPGSWTATAWGTDGGCSNCGSVPTAHVRLRSQTGMLVSRQQQGLEGPMCRSCGLAAFRDLTNRTLVRG